MLTKLLCLGGVEANLGYTIWIPTLDKPSLLKRDLQPNFIIKHVTDLLSILNEDLDVSEFEDSSSNASDGS